MRRLVVTCDDLGMHPTINDGIAEVLGRGIIGQASIMATGNHFNDAVKKLKKCGVTRVGVHLCLGSEYELLPGRPLCPNAEVRSLVDDYGNFYPRIRLVWRGFRIAEVERELRAQIRRVQGSGLTISHLDGHMFCYESCESGPAFEQVARTLAAELGVHLRVRQALPSGRPNTTFIWMECPTVEGRKEFYEKFLREDAEDGAELIIHPGKSVEAMATFTSSGPMRFADYDYFLNLDRARLAELGVTITTW